MANTLKLFVFAVVFVALHTSCKLQTTNSLSNDRDRYDDAPVRDADIEQSSQNFAEARAILKTNCAGCHAGFARYTEKDWVANQYVVPGNAGASLLYTRLRGSRTGGQENMPQGGALSASDIAAIYSWIQAIPTSSPSDGETAPRNAAERTAAALAVLGVSCTGCHGVTRTGTSSFYEGATVPAFSKFTDDNAFVTSGLIVPKRKEYSWLYQALKTWGSLNKMPKNKGALSEGARNALEEWINGMGEP